MSLALRGRRIAVTRPAEQAGALARMIEAEGGQAVLAPLLEIAAADDPRPLQQAIARLADYACAIFISPNAIAHALPAILAAGPWPARLQAAVIGPSSAALLASHGVTQVVAPLARYDSEALLDLPAMQRAAVCGKRILILRGNGGRDLLVQQLRERGAQVDAVSCYQRSAPRDGTAVASLLRDAALDALTISSSEALRHLLAALDDEALARLRGLPLFVPHRRIAEVAAGYGLPRVVLTAAADAGIMASLCAHEWPGHE